MGQHNTKQGLEGACKRAESRLGKIAITGRYHRLPKKLSDDYDLETKVLGSGYNGQVHVAKNKATGQSYAVKGFKLHGVAKDKKEELETEAEIFLAMDHPHVARLADVYESDDQLDLVMECMSGGELFKRVQERKRFSEKDAAVAAWQMLVATNYIHSHDVVHRDIKLENFLYESPNSDHLKLIDFGFSKVWDVHTKMALSCGTLAYVAPEVLDRSYTSQCDMWSLGVTIFIVLFGYMPFSGSEDKQVQAIKGGKYTVKKDAWARVSKNAQDFIAKLLVVDAGSRMNCDAALKHPWIAEREAIMNSEAHIDEGIANALADFGQASGFRRACMNMMAWSLTNEERAQVRDAFLEIDKSHTGTISIVEFKKVLEDKFHISCEVTMAAFQALDTAHSDEIHYSEFLAAMMSSRIQMHDDLLKQTFKRFDTENHGYISGADLKKVLGDSFEGEDVEKMLAEADVSHDGQIDYKEFINYLRGPMCSDAHAHAGAKFIDKEVAKNEHATTKSPKAVAKPGGGAKNDAGGQETKGGVQENSNKAQPKGCCTLQ